MTAAEMTPTQLTEIDGRVVSEAASGLVQVELVPIGGDVLPSLVAGEAVAFRPTEDTLRSDRFLGTVVSVHGGSEVTLLLDRVALTIELTTEQRDVTPFSPVMNTQEYGQRYY